MGEVRQLTMRGRYDSIPVITQFVGEAAQAAYLDDDAVFHCQMAVDEACTNIVEHAYNGEDKGDIEIACFVEPGSCEIQIVDHGRPFDPDSVPAPKIGVNLDQVQPGGIGLHLMRQLMDEVRFEFSAQGNKLTMIKRSSKVLGGPVPAPVPVYETDDNIWVVTPKGRLDSLAAPQLEETLQELVKQGRHWIVVDMGQISYISSRGLKVLVSAWRQARDAGGSLVLCGLSERLQEVFETVGFTQILHIFGTYEEACSFVASRKQGTPTTGE
jgi:anti-anti-sigma factor